MRLTALFHRSRTRAAGALAVAVLGLSIPMVHPASALTVQHAASPAKHGLKNGGMKAAVDAVRHGRHPKSLVEQDGGLVVEVRHHDGANVRETVAKVGGRVNGIVSDNVVQAVVPVASVEALEQASGIDEVRPATRVDGPAAGTAVQGATGGEAVSKTNAATWHSTGYTGRRVSVGIIDFFDGSQWTTAAAAGELPSSPAGTFCLNGGGACTLWQANPGPSHGVAVAEVIHDMAPDARLYVASATTAADLRAAVDWFAANGVRIVSRSLTSRYDGDGKGAGDVDGVIDYAATKKITWFQSAGNTASGGYWRGTWADANANGWLDFAPNDEFLALPCNIFVNGLRWSDWGTGRTDYDAYIYDTPNGTIKAKSEGDQSAGIAPLELTSQDWSCSGPNDVDYLSVKLYNAGSGTAGDVLEFMINGRGLSHSNVAYSATGPAADSKSTSEVTVGAIDPWNGTTIADYSSRGPVNDGRIKPDVSAASCITSSIYAPNCFNGTSAATPVAAGAAALMLDQYPLLSSVQVKTTLVTNATVDRGVVGTDNVYGKGEVILPNPATPDLTSPSLSGPRTAIAEGAGLGTTLVPYTVTYSGSDTSGIARYDVDVSVNSGAWSRIYSGTAKSAPFNATPGNRYQVRVTAYDYAGNWRKNTSRVLTVSNYGDANANVKYTTGWYTASTSSAYGASYTYTNSASANVYLQFTGDSVTWVATRGASFGSADVYIDGTFKKTVSLNSSTTAWRKAVYTWANASGNAETHDIKIVARGDGYVSLDSFVVTG